MTDTQYVEPRRLGSGEPDGTQFLRDDQTWAVPGSGTLTITERAGSGFSVTSGGGTGSGTATCNAGEVSIGGGWDASAGNQTYAYGSRRSGTTGWTISVRNEGGTTRTVTPYVICLAT